MFERVIDCVHAQHARRGQPVCDSAGFEEIARSTIAHPVMATRTARPPHRVRRKAVVHGPPFMCSRYARACVSPGPPRVSEP